MRVWVGWLEAGISGGGILGLECNFVCVAVHSTLNSESAQASLRLKLEVLTIYGPMIYTAPSIRILMRADG